MMDIQELIKVTNLKEPFVRKCLREMRAIFEPHIKRGKHNRLLFDSNAVKIFDQIMQDKEKGLSLTSIKETLFKSLNKVVEQETNGSNGGGQTYLNSDTNRGSRSPKVSLNASQEVVELKELLHQSEIEKITAFHRLEIIESNIKLLPSGGDPHEMKRIFNRMLEIVVELEIKTKPWFGHSRSDQRLWNELKQFLKGEN